MAGVYICKQERCQNINKQKDQTLNHKTPTLFLIERGFFNVMMFLNYTTFV